MPQLPSGRQVGIEMNRLRALLKSAGQEIDAQKRLADIFTVADLQPFVGIMFLVPENEAGNLRLEQDFRQDSLARPSGLVPMDSGYTAGESG